VAQFEAEFDADGLLQSITPGTGTTFDAVGGEIAFSLPSGPVTMSTGRIGESGGLTQIGSSYQPLNIGANGSPAGELQAVEVNEDGRVQAIYNTGIRRDLYQIPVADVSNPDGMTAAGNQAYRVSADSGDIYLWDAGDGPAGDISGYSLMESNTDIAAELTSLIETQRAYSSNAKIVQTVDEMLQETTNLKR
jgi:flagellar hook protein FlgE